MRKLDRCFTTLIVTFLVSCASAVAQPVGEESFAELQQQIADLRDELQQKNATKETQTHPQSDDRVREVGRQIVKRKPRSSYEEDIDLQIRLYDLSDLFVVSPNYPANAPREFQYSGGRVFSSGGARMVGGGGFGGGGFGGGGQGGGGGVFNIPPSPIATSPQESSNLNMQAAQVTLDQLVETLKETVKPEMWGSSSSSARIKYLGNTLLITATEEMHTQITQLFNLFREHWGKRRTVSIQTWWVRADHGTADELLDKKTTEAIGAGVVAAERWKTFFSKAKEEQRTLYSATLTGHNNQTLHALSGKQVRLTVDAEPFKSHNTQWHVKDLKELEPDVAPFEDGGDDNFGCIGRQKHIIGFRPLDAVFHDGAIIQVTPLATRGGNYVILDLQAKLNALLSNEQQKSMFVEDNGKRIEVKLDDIDYITSRFSSTLRCPKGEVVLAGSMTGDPNAKSDSPEILVFVRASVHTIEEDRSDWKKSTQLSDRDTDAKAAVELPVEK